MDVFRGWYRRSLAGKNAVWHHVCHVDSVLCDRQMAVTVCGRYISTTKCDFSLKAIGSYDKQCVQCNRSSVETGRGFVPVGAISIVTKESAVRELKRLSKPRIYFVKIWGNEGLEIKAIWESDTSIAIYTEHIHINRRKVLTLEQVQEDLDRFKSAIDCLCDASDVLAKEEKIKKGLKGRLTPSEQNTYFEELLWEMGKQNDRKRQNISH